MSYDQAIKQVLDQQIGACPNCNHSVHGLRILGQHKQLVKHFCSVQCYYVWTVQYKKVPRSKLRQWLKIKHVVEPVTTGPTMLTNTFLYVTKVDKPPILKKCRQCKRPTYHKFCTARCKHTHKRLKDEQHKAGAAARVATYLAKNKA